MSTASRGRALEHEVRELFRAAGYSVVRGAGSKGEVDLGDGPEKVDLLATRVTDELERKIYIVGLQCKLRRLHQFRQGTEHRARNPERGT